MTKEKRLCFSEGNDSSTLSGTFPAFYENRDLLRENLPNKVYRFIMSCLDNYPGLPSAYIGLEHSVLMAKNGSPDDKGFGRITFHKREVK